jgi:hypothetical protein
MVPDVQIVPVVAEERRPQDVSIVSMDPKLLNKSNFNAF